MSTYSCSLRICLNRSYSNLSWASSIKPSYYHSLRVSFNRSYDILSTDHFILFENNCFGRILCVRLYSCVLLKLLVLSIYGLLFNYRFFNWGIIFTDFYFILFILIYSWDYMWDLLGAAHSSSLIVADIQFAFATTKIKHRVFGAPDTPPSIVKR